MPRVPASVFKAIKRKTAAKKARRRDNARFIARVAAKPRLPSLTVLASQVWDALTAYVRRRDGPKCRICGVNDGYALYHLVPQMEGNAVRYWHLNVAWGCSTCNFNESHHRALYARKHEAIFGKDYMDALWAKAKPVDEAGRPVYTQLRRGHYMALLEEIRVLNEALGLA